MLFYFEENLASNGTATQSSDFYWTVNQTYLAYLKAYLAITGGPTHDFYCVSCATTLVIPIQYMLCGGC